MTHIETIKYMKSALDNALNSFEVPMTAGIAEALAAANKAIGEGGPTEKQRSGSDSERTDPPSLDYDEAVRIQRASLAEQVHTPYCKQAPMCKTPCGNSDCVEQAEQEPEYKGWYCAHCERGVDGSEVTFHEQHEVCGRVITDDVPPKPVKQEPAARVAAEIGKELP